MPKTRQQQHKERKAAQRKAARKAARVAAAPQSRKAILRAAAAWPVWECWVNEDWRDPTHLNQIVVARRHPLSGEIFAGIYLVDRACLGVKNAYVTNFATVGEFRRELLSPMEEHQTLIQVDLNLAAAIIQAGIDYAAPLGFRPHPDYEEAAILLDEADPRTVTEEIPVGGPEGKPFYVPGPYDNAPRIMAQLERKLGPDGFYSLHGLGPAAETGAEEDAAWADWDEEEELDEEMLETIGQEIAAIEADMGPLEPRLTDLEQALQELQEAVERERERLNEEERRTGTVILEPDPDM